MIFFPENISLTPQRQLYAASKAMEGDHGKAIY